MPVPGSLTADYDFDLPPHLVAQAPLARRDASRLMVVDRAAGTIAHRTFAELPPMMDAGDVLVLNTTRVFRARLLGTRESGGRAEVLLLRAHGDDVYEAMVFPGSKLRPGRRVTVAPGFEVEMLGGTDRRTRLVRLHAKDSAEGSAEAAIERHGHLPLPPYIRRPDDAEDAERYQTVYARERGSVAAPTAGLHFSPGLLAAIAERGVRRADVLLHVGVGTFKPVAVDDPADHEMHEERFELGPEAAATLDAARSAERHIWAVGTTSLRTLESVVDGAGRFAAAAGDTRIFIRPPHVVRSADRLITNFHLPRSTLLMLVASFAGYELTMRAYAEAVANEYRFYSYGDAMVIV